MPADYERHPNEARELMLRLGVRPRLCGCCICFSIPRHNRRRARRVFRLTRAVMRSWEKEQQRLTDDGLSRNA